MRCTTSLVALAAAITTAVALPTEARQNNTIAINDSTTSLNSTSTFTKRDFDNFGDSSTACEIIYENWWKAVFTEHRVTVTNCNDKSGEPYEILFDKLPDMLPSSISVTGYNWILGRAPDKYWIHFNSIIGTGQRVCNTLKDVSEHATLRCIDR